MSEPIEPGYWNVIYAAVAAALGVAFGYGRRSTGIEDATKTASEAKSAAAAAQADVTAHRIYASDTYVKKAEFDKRLDRIEDKLESIDGKLDNVRAK